MHYILCIDSNNGNNNFNNYIMKNENEPSAFPRHVENDWNNQYTSGMTLRDYFASKAMQGMFNVDVLKISDNVVKVTNKTRSEWFAEQAYNFADAMLKQREL